MIPRVAKGVQLFERLIKLEATKEPPSEFILFKAGENRSTKGTVTYDPSEAAELQARYDAEDGRDLVPIDVAHLSVVLSTYNDLHDEAKALVVDGNSVKEMRRVELQPWPPPTT